MPSVATARSMHHAGLEQSRTTVESTLTRSPQIDAATRAAITDARASLIEEGRPVEHFRRLSLDDALARLG